MGGGVFAATSAVAEGTVADAAVDPVVISATKPNLIFNANVIATPIVQHPHALADAQMTADPGQARAQIAADDRDTAAAAGNWIEKFRLGYVD